LIEGIEQSVGCVGENGIARGTETEAERRVRERKHDRKFENAFHGVSGNRETARSRRDARRERGQMIPARLFDDSLLGEGIITGCRVGVGGEVGKWVKGDTFWMSGLHSDSANVSLRECGGTPAKLSYR
jgi:hypothetical protein